MNLVPAIREMQNEINNVTFEYHQKIDELESGLKTLRKLNTACENCNGTGKVKKQRSCAEDDDFGYDITCPVCRGSGRSIYVET